MKKKVGIIGASGWIGQGLMTVLKKEEYEVVPFSRSEKSGWRQWGGEAVPDLSGLDAVVNLAGEAIDQRWTEERKKHFYDSRVKLTEHLAQGVTEYQVKTLLNASAVGFYGDRGDEKLTEESDPGSGYLAELCQKWEGAVGEIKARTVLLRTGIVLGKGGRAWEKMSSIFRLGIGGRLGSGQQWMPWIHLEDEINAIIHCLESDLKGPVNLVAPESERNVHFTKKVSQALHRPAFLPAPAFALKIALGEFAEEGLLSSQRAIPEVLLQDGFEFTYPSLGEALVELSA